jgi:hypothetical protein
VRQATACGSTRRTYPARFIGSMPRDHSASKIPPGGGRASVGGSGSSTPGHESGAKSARRALS